jgi:hypothetical protein
VVAQAKTEEWERLLDEHLPGAETKTAMIRIVTEHSRADRAFTEAILEFQRYHRLVYGSPFYRDLVGFIRSLDRSSPADDGDAERRKARSSDVMKSALLAENPSISTAQAAFEGESCS